MNAEQAGQVLAKCASYDRRKTGDADTIAWYQVLQDLSYDDCIAAVIAHYSDTTDWIMPAHIRQRVKAMRADRLSREITPAPPHELADEPGRFRAELKANLREIADGFSIPKAIAGPVREDEPPETWAEARAKFPPPLTPQEIARQQAAESRAARAADEGEPAA